MHLSIAALSVFPLLASAATTTWYKPKAGTSLLWSIEGGPIPADPKSSTDVDLSKFQVYDVDLFDTTAAQIKQYKQRGKRVVCYFSAGSLEPWRADANKFSSKCYCGKADRCKMDGWDEWWLDLHSLDCAQNVRTVMKSRLDLAATKGCDMVEPDNVDSYTNEPGFATTLSDEYNYLKWLAQNAHSRGLGIVLKNSPNMIEKQPYIVSLFDAVLIEECAKYNECEAYAPFAKAGKAVWQVEYEVKTVKCPIPGFFALAYSNYSVDYRNIRDYCPK